MREPAAAGAGAAGSQPRPRFADAAGFALLLVFTAALFGLSGGMLWVLGVNYDGLSGSAVSKIHPSTYLACLLFGWIVVSARDPVGLLVDMARRRPGALLLLVATVLFFGRIVLNRAPGMAGVLDTFLPPALLALVLSRAGARTLGAMELTIHALMAVNAAMGILEFVSGTLIFPYRLDGEMSIYDTRSTALQGHPLQNATLTAVYVLALLSRGGPAVGERLRVVLVLLQCAALVTFGGRSAMVTTLVLGGGVLLWQANASLSRGRVALPAAAAVVLALILLPLGVGGLAAGGFFDDLLSRFVSDGGSANARLLMLDLLDLLSWRDLLVGPDPLWFASVRRMTGLEWGIENPILRILFAQGLIFTVLMTVAVTLFLSEIARRSGRGWLLPLLAFVVLINTFESLGGKTTLLTKFAVLMICFHRPVPAPARQACPRPSAARIGGSKARVASSISPNPSNRFQNAQAYPKSSAVRRTSVM